MICSCYDDAFCDRALATSPRVKMALPFLPGNSFDTNVRAIKIMSRVLQCYQRIHINWLIIFLPQLGRTKFHKSQLFEFRNSDVPVCVDESKPGIGESQYATRQFYNCKMCCNWSSYTFIAYLIFHTFMSISAIIIIFRWRTSSWL